MSYLIPGDALIRRDWTAPGVDGSNYLIGTTLGAFGDQMFAASLIGRLPLQMLPGLVENVAMPTGVSAVTTWVAEDGVSEVADAALVATTRGMSPHTLGTLLTVSHQFNQMLGPGAKLFVERWLGRAMGEALDKALIAGTGNSGQPSGAIHWTGIATTSGTSLGWTGVRTMLKNASGYAVSDPQWVLGITAADLLRSRETFSGAGPVLDGGNRIAGAAAVTTRAAPDDAAVCAPWGQVTVGQWGALELSVNPYTDFKTGKIKLRLLSMVDFTSDSPAAVAVSTSIT